MQPCIIYIMKPYKICIEFIYPKPVFTCKWIYRIYRIRLVSQTIFVMNYCWRGCCLIPLLWLGSFFTNILVRISFSMSVFIAYQKALTHKTKHKQARYHHHFNCILLTLVIRLYMHILHLDCICMYISRVHVFLHFYLICTVRTLHMHKCYIYYL